MLLCQFGARFTISLFAYNFQKFVYNLRAVFSKLFFVFLQSNKAKFSRHNSHMNQFMLIASGITGDSEKGDDLFLFVTTFLGYITRFPILLNFG